MKKSRFTESQIVAVLQKAEQGHKIANLCRELGISEVTFYSWRCKYGGMTVNELKRVKELEEENAWLKRKYADLNLVNDALKQVSKKVRGPVERKLVAVSMIVDCGISVVQASKVTGVARLWSGTRASGSTRPITVSDTRCNWSTRKSSTAFTPLPPLFVPDAPNKVWSMDFMHDSLWNGKPFRVLNVVDDYNRQASWIEPDTSLPAERVVRVLNQLKESRGVPAMIRVDNGPELVSIKLDLWCRENGVTLAFIQPGKPTQNAFIERFNRTLRNEVLNAYVFRTSVKCVSTRTTFYSTTSTIGPTRG